MSSIARTLATELAETRAANAATEAQARASRQQLLGVLLGDLGQRIIDGSVLDAWFPGLDWTVVHADPHGQSIIVQPSDPSELPLLFQLTAANGQFGADSIAALEQISVAYGDRQPNLADRLQQRYASGFARSDGFSWFTPATPAHLAVLIDQKVWVGAPDLPEVSIDQPPVAQEGGAA